MTVKQINALKRAHNLIEEFRKLDENMPIQQVAVFLTVALNKNISQKEIADIVGMGQGSASRNVSAFLKTNRFKRPGFDLIDNEPDPMELRKKKYAINSRGKRVVNTIVDILKEGR